MFTKNIKKHDFFLNNTNVFFLHNTKGEGKRKAIPPKTQATAKIVLGAFRKQTKFYN